MEIEFVHSEVRTVYNLNEFQTIIVALFTAAVWL